MNWWVEATKLAGPILSPFVALAGAIWLYYAKQKADREETRRRDQILLYSETLSAAHKVRSSLLLAADPEELLRQSTDFHLAIDKLLLLAPGIIHAQSLKLQETFRALALAQVKNGRSSFLDRIETGEDMPLVDAMAEEESKLSALMKADIDAARTDLRRLG